MSVQTQKEAVFSAVSSVLSEAGIAVNEGENFASVLTKELRSRVTNILVEGFNNGTIAIESNPGSEAKLRTYCSGLISNWLRKDTRMNGGSKYVAQKPGSRVGSTDPQLKAMRLLLQTKTDPAAREEIQGFINARVEQIRASKKTSARTLTAEQVALLESAGLGSLVSA